MAFLVFSGSVGDRPRQGNRHRQIITAVIPAKAGIQLSAIEMADSWIPAFAGMTNEIEKRIVGEMMVALKLTPVGDSVGFVLPKAAQARLGVEQGDTIFLTEAPDGGYRLSAHSPEFAGQMRLSEDIMSDDREILRALAR